MPCLEARYPLLVCLALRLGTHYFCAFPFVCLFVCLYVCAHFLTLKISGSATISEPISMKNSMIQITFKMIDIHVFLFVNENGLRPLWA